MGSKVRKMMEKIFRSGHPIFRASSGFERGELRSKGEGKKSKHFNGSDENIELLQWFLQLSSVSTEQ